MTKRVFWKIGDHEIEVEGDNALIQKQLKLFFDRVGGQHLQQQAVSKDLPSKIVAGAKSGKALSPAEYYRQKNPSGGTATLIVLGKYLDEFRSKGEFTRKDINALAREVRIKPIHAQYYSLAVKQGLLRAIGRGTYGLSITGEDTVAAMPSNKE